MDPVIMVVYMPAPDGALFTPEIFADSIGRMLPVEADDMCPSIRARIVDVKVVDDGHAAEIELEVDGGGGMPIVGPLFTA